MTLEKAELIQRSYHSIGVASGPPCICDVCSKRAPARNVRGEYRATYVPLKVCETCFRSEVLLTRNSPKLAKAAEAVFASNRATAGRRATQSTPSPAWRQQTDALKRQLEAKRHYRPAVMR